MISERVPKLAAIARWGLPNRPNGSATNHWTLTGRPHTDTVHHRKTQPCPPSSRVLTCRAYTQEFYLLLTIMLQTKKAREKIKPTLSESGSPGGTGPVAPPGRCPPS